ncbi:hypothetical protein [Mesobacillus subterraneus]|uniref:Transmembrane protein n=1 Tax=Mesobacillus subterraneus TaxID=285983 RepID=A0A427TX69_9BACI|nr:hypothetical protein [Mesobacillus subterraneus]RSD29078.1 hypothetical protein EJA10_02935 [Mesobacillus subterraneus]
MESETEVSGFLEIVFWLVILLSAGAALLSMKKNNAGIYFLLFAILHSLSLLFLRNLLISVPEQSVMASEENTLRLYLFIFPWFLSMAALVIGILKTRSQHL